MAPPESWIKLNFDGSAMMGSIAAGGILENNMGMLVVAYLGNYGGGSNNKVEVLSLHCGLKIVRARGVTKLVIKGVYMLIINAAKGEGK